MGNPVVNAPAAVRMVDVAYSYPDGQVALDGLSLTIDAGEHVAVLGPNGSGKTTLVHHLNGILKPMLGTVEIDGLRVEEPHLADIRRRVGVVFQDPDDQLFMPTVRQDVAFGPANYGHLGNELEARVTGALRAVDLMDCADRTPHHLSFGQRRRAALATVLSMDPSVLVFDEPSANLDPAARHDLAGLILAEKRTVIVVTHDLLYAAELCERSVIIDDGVIVADGPTLELLADAELLAAHRLELPKFASIPGAASVLGEHRD